MLTPAHQFPTGVVLDGARRRELRRWAQDGGLIIEDDYDAEHRYDRPPVPALRAALPDRVCYAGSVSKLLAPALRLGWLLVPPAYHEDLVAAKRRADLGNAVLPQLVLADLMGSGELEHHLRLLRKRHVRRRDAMIAAVGAHLPRARIHGAAAGLHLTVTFDACRPIRAPPIALSPTPPWTAGSRCSRCPGTASGPSGPGSSWGTPPAPRPRSLTESPSSARPSGRRMGPDPDFTAGEGSGPPGAAARSGPR